MKKLILLVIILLPPFGFTQQSDPFESWKWLLGEWVGEGNGQPGKGSGEFSLFPDLDNKILVRKNHSEYPATKDKPKIIHDDLMVVYLDFSGNPNKAIYFDNENHVINYNISYSANSIILTSEKIPNVPVFRLTYASVEKELINVKFEMSQDGENFTVYSEGKCERRK